MAVLGIGGDRSAAATKVAAAFRNAVNPTTLVALLLAAILVFLVANPLFQLVKDSFTNARDHSFTFANYVTAFGRPRYVQALINSVELGAVAALFASIIAVPLAWGVSRTDMPGRGFVHVMVLASFLIPPFVGAIGWILLGGPNAGWINKAWMAVTGAPAGPFNIFTFWGLALVTALYSFPLIYVFTKSALDLISTEMEEAAAILGAGPAQTTFRVTLPLALPAILGSVFLVFLEVLGLYGTPALIAIPAGFNVVTTQLAAFFENPVRVEVAAAFSMPMVGITIVLLWVQRRLLARKSYVTVGGKGGHREPMALGAFRWVLFAYAMAIAGLSVFMPLFIILQTAFSKAWALPMSAPTLPSIISVGTVRPADGAAGAVQHLPIRHHHRDHLHIPGLCRRLYLAAQTAALLPSAGQHHAGAVRGARHRARDLLLCGLCTTAVRALRARRTGRDRLCHALFADRLHQFQFGDPGPASRTGRGGADRRRQPGSRALAGGAADPEEITVRKLALDLHHRDPGVVDRDVPVRAADPGGLGADAGIERTGPYEMLSAISVLLLVVTGVVTLVGAAVLGRDFMLRRN